MALPPVVEIAPDAPALVARTAHWVCSLLAGRREPVAVGLSGGATPRGLYEALAAPPFRDRMPWDRIHWFWGDERHVPADHPDSNQRMAREAMLGRVPVPEGNIHPIRTDLPAGDAAAAYERELQSFHGADRPVPGRPVFRLLLLGIGEDGHTASLFPGAASLGERDRWAVAVAPPPGVRPAVARITLTLPILESADTVAFLAAGPGKAGPVADALGGRADSPAARVRPATAVHWLLDAAAAGRLPGHG